MPYQTIRKFLNCHRSFRVLQEQGLPKQSERRSRSGGLSQVSRGELTLETEIEVRGVVKTLRQWVEDMKPGDKLRCEAPFRVSSSEAAFIAFDRSGEPFVHDSGTATTYRLSTPLGDLVEEFNERYAMVNEGGKALVRTRARHSVGRPASRPTGSSERVPLRPSAVRALGRDICPILLAPPHASQTSHSFSKS